MELPWAARSMLPLCNAYRARHCRSDSSRSDMRRPCAPHGRRIPELGRTCLPRGIRVDGGVPMPFDETPMTASSTDDWSLDVLNNSDFDWNFFLTAEMPAFSSFAPDGTM